MSTLVAPNLAKNKFQKRPSHRRRRPRQTSRLDRRLQRRPPAQGFEHDVTLGVQVLELAPLNWNDTIVRAEVQQALAANVLRRVVLEARS